MEVSGESHATAILSPGERATHIRELVIIVYQQIPEVVTGKLKHIFRSRICS
jgi:hypothetical protein